MGHARSSGYSIASDRFAGLLGFRRGAGGIGADRRDERLSLLQTIRMGAADAAALTPEQILETWSELEPVDKGPYPSGAAALHNNDIIIAGPELWSESYGWRPLVAITDLPVVEGGVCESHFLVMAAHGPVSRDVLGTVHVDVGAKASVLYSGRDLAQVFQVAGEKTQAKLKDGYARPDGTPTPAAEALTEENFRIRFTERARLGRNYHA